ncbi:MAG: asparagine synthase (glutamine-hydrolyzing) [Rhodospirillales bacterium]|nr:asparagine synthase (glutamine-hydrolyzing) [Rhodospirillales bacterium]
MCGIAGMTMMGEKLVDPGVIDKLASAMLHRGPDGEGRHERSGTTMVQVRLAIIDLDGGDQPFYEGDLALIANGEIYNYCELRNTMTDVEFSTASDCEPPLHLYASHGLEFVKHLRGMYTIAIDDKAGDQLVLARDPFGIKPLYYAETEDGFIFASEAQAIIATGLVEAELVADKQDELLQLQFTTGRQTIFAGIHRVMPGEVLVIRDGRIAERHNHAALPDGGTRGLSEDEALRLLDEYLEESVNLHQRADVDYGMFLSGGIDSSAILAMMARLNVRPVQAFTIGFDGTDVHDERALAQRAAASVGAEHEEISFTEDDFWTLLPRVAAAMDDPAADYAVLPTYKLAQTAHEAGLKVILSGEGGDELFGGYGRYRRAARWKIFGGRPMRQSGTFDGLGVLRREPTGWREGIAASEATESHSGRTRLQAVQATDIADWLPNDLLGKLDRCLMAHGIEGRVPFIDPVLADCAFRLPDRLKTSGRLGKVILRKWLAQALPVSEPFKPKMGFTVPVGQWIGTKGDQLGPLVARQPGIEALCQPGTVESLFSAAAGSGAKREKQAAWTLLFYALWHRQHIGGMTPDGDIFHCLENA